jgi:hypothetical protein
MFKRAHNIPSDRTNAWRVPRRPRRSKGAGAEGHNIGGCNGSRAAARLLGNLVLLAFMGIENKFLSVIEA